MVQLTCMGHWVGNCKRLGLRTQDQRVRMHYCVLIIIFAVDNFVMGLTLRPVEARPNRKAENGSGVIGQRRSESPLGDLWEQCKLSHSKLRRKIWIFEHFWTSKITPEQSVR